MTAGAEKLIQFCHGEHLCSRCKKRPPRAGQRYCNVCHAANMRAWRGTRYIATYLSSQGIRATKDFPSRELAESWLHIVRLSGLHPAYLVVVRPKIAEAA